ncbi:MAG TPA: dockerin type I domain-containing protein [Candidatus Limnocylindrales bacterium]|nr:dockerin type I domain-containing protein [Candidatus Limnocylindrales bacterium]
MLTAPAGMEKVRAIVRPTGLLADKPAAQPPRVHEPYADIRSELAQDSMPAAATRRPRMFHLRFRPHLPSAALAAAIVLAGAAPARANFHFAHISRVMSGQPQGDVQYVEIVMTASGQHVVSGSKLAAFDSTGAFSHVITTLSSNVTGGDDRPWIMASEGFAAASGITPDFVFSTADGNGLIATDAMVCWGKPIDQTNPNHYVDCVAYGNYEGPDNDHTTAPHPLDPFGHGLVRGAHMHNSALDFFCEAPAMPRNNAQQTGTVQAQVPCECGNDVVDGDEECDRTDDEACPGGCTAECLCSILCGDANGDGEIKATDALAVLRAAVGADSTCTLATCDVDDNGSILASDSLRVLRAAVGADVDLTCPA